MAANGCSGSPSLSVERGWTWYSRSGVARSGPYLANMPNWLGAIDIGPLRVRAYCKAMRALPKGPAGQVVQRQGIADLVDSANLQMILQVFADPLQVVDDIDAQPRQPGLLPDARQFQQLGAVDRSGGQDDLGIRPGAAGQVALQPFPRRWRAVLGRRCG